MVIILVTQMLTRDLFAVANLLVHYNFYFFNHRTLIKTKKLKR